MTEKNYLIRQADLLKRVRRGAHRPTQMVKNPKAYSRKQKHRVDYMEMNNGQLVAERTNR